MGAWGRGGDGGSGVVVVVVGGDDVVVVGGGCGSDRGSPLSKQAVEEEN